MSTTGVPSSLLHAPLVAALRDPAQMLRFDDAQWDLVIRQGRAAGLLGRLGALAATHGLQAQLPEHAARHLTAMLSVAEKQARAVHWEVKQIARALAGTGIPVVLLKGAAYAAAGLPAAAGRTFADVDILVPKAELARAEKRLMLSGWLPSVLDDYDKRYYRKWMHELPPMQHAKRQTPLDVHHNILPETARIRTRPDRIIAAAVPLAGHVGIHVPSRVDQILHSATHLFHEGEWEHGLRDLSDLDLLIRAYARGDAFWPQLLARAAELNLALPLRYALRYSARILGTPVPADAEASLLPRRGRMRERWMDWVFMNGFASAHHSCRTGSTGSAQFLLYVRSHWLRMPLHLLLPHLVHKALAPMMRKNNE